MGDDVIGRVEDIVARLAKELAGEIALDGERASVSVSAGDLRTLLALARSNRDAGLFNDLSDFFDDLVSDLNDAEREGYETFQSMIGSRWTKRVRAFAEHLDRLPSPPDTGE